MNNYQKILKSRLTRKFSNSDGVSYKDDKGVVQVGVIQSVQNFDEQSNQWSYYVRNINTNIAILLSESCLKSEPYLNKGKYGGPSRGGAPEKDIVFSSYR